MYFDESWLTPLQFAKTPADIATATYQIFQQMMAAGNYVDGSNIGSPLNASQVLAPGSAGLSTLNWAEWPIPLVLPGTPLTTTSTAGLAAGGFWVWDPAKFPGGSWYFEAALQSTVATSDVSAQLMNGAAVLATVTTGNNAWTVVRSPSPVTMPGSQAALTVQLLTSVGTTTAALWAARMIFVPS